MEPQPPFKLPLGLGNVKTGPWQKLNIEAASDGEQRHWPPKTYRPSSETTYLVRLGNAWAEHTGIVQHNVNYYLDKLPDGYGAFEIDQPGGPQVYKRLFGHPSGRYYDSILRFQPHFFWLMDGMEGDCPCICCSKLSGKPLIQRVRRRRQDDLVADQPRRTREVMKSDRGDSTRSSSAAGVAPGREKRARAIGPTYATDEEGTKDIYKDCIQNLYQARESRHGIEYDIFEVDSFDWKAEKKSLTQYLTRIELQHSFVPRLGELVLWCNYFPDDHYLLKDTEKNEFKLYSFEQRCFHGFPDWRAGVVTAVPNSTAVDGPVDFPDILDCPSKKTALNASGFRVETIPDPNHFDKSASKQYRYIPMRSIRPLSHWQHVLNGFPRKRMHRSIFHALTCMTSISLLDRFKFTGEWPNGSIHCKGIYIGSELITLGDAVRISSQARLSPSNSTSKSKPDLLLVSAIRLNLHAIDPVHTTVSSPLLSTQTTITMIGSAYSLDPSRDHRIPTATQLASDSSITSVTVPEPVDDETAKSLFRPVGAVDYGAWYPIHDAQHRYEVSHDQVFGRLYESRAVKMWTGDEQFKLREGETTKPPSLDFDIPGIIAGREYATEADERIPEPFSPDEKILWHLADYRAQGLAIETSNGLEVGVYDDVRDKKTLASWRAILKVRKGDLSAVKDSGLPHAKGRQPGTRIVDGKAVYPGEEVVRTFKQQNSSQMMKAAREETESSADVEDSMETGSEQMQGLMRGYDGLDNNNSNNDNNNRSRSHSQRSKIAPEYSGEERSRSRSAAGKDKERDKGKGKAVPPTKEQIMRSVEGGEALPDEDEDDDNDDAGGDGYDEFDFLNEPLPPARGGTEESDGGDYDPTRERAAESPTPIKPVKAGKAGGAGDGRKWLDQW